VTAAHGGGHARTCRAPTRAESRAPGTAEDALLEPLRLLLERLASALRAALPILLLAVLAAAFIPLVIARHLLGDVPWQHPPVRLSRQLSDADRARTYM
jgi:hypothetical protein